MTLLQGLQATAFKTTDQNDVRADSTGDSGTPESTPNLITEPNPTEPDLYVATDLTWFAAEHPHRYAVDVAVQGIVYRRLDVAYYAWLRHRLFAAEKAWRAGKLTRQSFDVLYSRFEWIFACATTLFGEEKIKQAIAALNAESYVPPTMETVEGRIPLAATPSEKPTYSGHLYPPDGDWPRFHPVDNRVVAIIDSIRDQALSLGWTMTGLYQNRGTFAPLFGQDYGIICHLRPEDRIVEVTERYIDVAGSSSKATPARYYNKDVDQPWSKRRTS